MLKEIAKAIPILLMLIISGCTAPKTNLFPPGENDKIVSVYLVNHGRHTGLIVPVKSIPTNIWPEAEDFGHHQYIEAGWGDEDFFKDPNHSFWVTVKAVLLPTDSTIHIVGFNKPVKEYFPEINITKIDLSEKGFNNLCKFVSDKYFHDKENKTHFIAPGRYGNSKFYKANGKYYFPQMCNLWTARALEVAGCPVAPTCVITSKEIMSQANEFGTIIRKND